MIAILIATAIAIAALAGSLLLSWLFARTWCRPGRTKSTHEPADYDLLGEDVAFPSHTAELKGWFVSAPRPRAGEPAVVLVHGWSQNAGTMLPVARQFHQAGVSALLFDARGHGESPDDGPITMLKFAQDIIAAVAYLRTRSDVDKDRIAVVGHSIGGSATLLAASMEPAIGAVATFAAFADPVTLTRRTLRHFHIPRWPFLGLASFFIERWLGRPMHSIAPLHRIAEIQVPLLLVHGEQDRFVTPGDLRKLYGAANKRSTRTLLVPGRRHMDVIEDLQYTANVPAFIRQALLAPPHSAAAS